MVRSGAAKSLALPGRKQATATKLSIYSTHSPRSSIHFLVSCSNFCKTLKKKIRISSVQPGLLGSNDLHVGRKMAIFQLFFRSREQVVVGRGQVRRIGWVIKILETQTCYEAHEQTPLSKDTITPSYDIGNLVGLRIYRHQLVCNLQCAVYCIVSHIVPNGNKIC
jgi:hypothetical protein